MKSAVSAVARRFGAEEKLREISVKARRFRVGFEEPKVLPENMVWVFGTGRSGSTWISRMMRDLSGFALWNEPLVGHMIGHLYHQRGSEIQHLRNFMFGGDESLWLPPLREYILSAATAKYPQNAGESRRYLVVKEPHGSIGADLISRALPESRMVLLVRDPRDVTASKLDAHRPDGWARKGRLYSDLSGDETKYVTARAEGYAVDMDNAHRAYRVHPGPKATVRYEDVRAEPEEHLRRLLEELRLPVRPADIAATVRKHDWSKVPEAEKGRGKIRRKARPGGWQEDLTEEQILAVESATAKYLDLYYPDFPRMQPGGVA
ncbi:sulfotransferase [Rubrobacter indicoceani]|uniref:sulfotransferase n=1 Tax=Rubrobacter indicoceani TaxID=2051957 RepID=UPI000E5AEDE4|nr:sulfotransferase [Rubrobacter indicoceani]